MKIKLIILFVISQFQLFSQQVDFEKGSILEKNYFEEISYEIEKGKIIIPVIINEKTYRFLLDTGAPNVISKELFEELKVKELITTTIVDANNLQQSMQVTQIPSLKIGNITFENQTALIYDLASHNLLNCYNIDGFIGSNALIKSSLKISKTEQKIYITNNVKNLNPKKKPLKLTLIGSQKAPYIEFNFIGKNKKKASDMVLIDTGMDGSYDMSNRAFAIFEKYEIFDIIAKSEGISSIGIFGAGKPSLQRILQVETAIINKIPIKNLLIETTDDSNSRIGLELLNHVDLIIDFKNRNAYFESKETFILDSKIPKYNTSVVDNKYVIGIVWDENLAKKMSFGDEIVSIDSRKISEMTLCDILNAKGEWRKKTNIILEIKNKNNEIITIEIEK